MSKKKPKNYSFHYCYTCDSRNVSGCMRNDCLVSITHVKGSYSHTMHNIKIYKPKVKVSSEPMFIGSAYGNDIGADKLAPTITNIIPKQVVPKHKIHPLIQYVSEKHEVLRADQEQYLKKVFGESMMPDNLKEHLNRNL